MIKKFVRKKLFSRHFWRYAEFDELLELYTSNMFRAIAVNLFNVFIPIYLLKNGYSLTVVSLYYVAYFIFRFFGDLLSGLVTARIGPKHAWIISHSCRILALVCLLELANHPILLLPSSVFLALSMSFQFIPMFVNFSKIKNDEHCGKEQGYFSMLENFGMAIGPVLGGVVAAWYGANFTIIASICLFFVSVAILLVSKENVRTRQRIKFRGISFKAIKRDVVSYSARGTNTTTLGSLLPIYLALVVLGDDTYALVGVIATVGFVCAGLASYILGRVADNWHPRRLLRIVVYVGSIATLLWTVVGGFIGALIVGSVGQSARSGIDVVYNKGLMAAADDLPGYRIVYFTLLEMVSELWKMIFWIILAVLSTIVSDKVALQSIFILSAFVLLLMNTERFKALDRR